MSYHLLAIPKTPLYRKLNFSNELKISNFLMREILRQIKLPLMPLYIHMSYNFYGIVSFFLLFIKTNVYVSIFISMINILCNRNCEEKTQKRYTGVGGN